MQKKTIIKVSFGLLFIALIVGIAVSSSSKNDLPEVAESFPTELLQSKMSLEKSSLERPRLIIFYNPECEHCQYEAETLSTNPDFQNLDVYWVSGAASEDNQAFKASYASAAPASFHFLDDKQYQIGNALGVRTFPTIFIYGEDGSLLYKYEGETKPEAILKWLT